MLASFSVRTRIVLLALIPVAGFVANGFTYTSGEDDVGRTFDTFTRSASLADASHDFKSAVASMRTLGFDESSGLRRQLQVAGNALERIINDSMSWLPEADANKLMVTLLYMRHHEADFRVTETEVARQQFQQAYKAFTDIVRPTK